MVLAYSGGLDTSAAIKWIAETYDMDVVTLSIDLGMERDFESIRQRALKVGAVKAQVMDARDAFINDYVFPALQADAIRCSSAGLPGHRDGSIDPSSSSGY